MRGKVPAQPSMLCMISVEDRIPKDHPLRGIKALADDVLERMSPTFDRMYGKEGRPSVPPERLLKASLLIALFSIRSERQFAEQLDYNLLYRWFLDMDPTEPGIDHSTFSRNRQRLLDHDVAREFFAEVVETARRKHLLSNDHFTVDGTLIEAWASLKSFRPKDEKPEDRPPPDDPGNPTVDFHGEKRSNETHRSTTDPESRLYRKSNGTTAKLCFMGHALMENRSCLITDLLITEANGRAEREAAAQQLFEHVGGNHRVTVGADKAYDTRAFVERCREMKVTPHVAQNTRRTGGSAIDARTTRHAGYAVSQQKRKRIEEFFGWMKTVGGLRRTRFKGIERTQLAAWLVGAAYNMLRMTKLLQTPA